MKILFLEMAKGQEIKAGQKGIAKLIQPSKGGENLFSRWLKTEKPRQENLAEKNVVPALDWAPAKVVNRLENALALVGIHLNPAQAQNQAIPTGIKGSKSQVQEKSALTWRLVPKEKQASVKLSLPKVLEKLPKAGEAKAEVHLPGQPLPAKDGKSKQTLFVPKTEPATNLVPVKEKGKVLPKQTISPQIPNEPNSKAGAIKPANMDFKSGPADIIPSKNLSHKPLPPTAVKPAHEVKASPAPAHLPSVQEPAKVAKTQKDPAVKVVAIKQELTEVKVSETKVQPGLNGKSAEQKPLAPNLPSPSLPRPERSQGEPMTREQPVEASPQTVLPGKKQKKQQPGMNKIVEQREKTNISMPDKVKQNQETLTRPHSPTKEMAGEPTRNQVQTPVQDIPATTNMEKVKIATSTNANIDVPDLPNESAGKILPSQNGEMPKGESGKQNIPSLPRLLNQVGQGLQQAFILRPKSVLLKLSPEELGEIKVQVTLEKDLVQAKIQTESQRVVTILREHQTELEYRMREQGIDVEKVEIKNSSDEEERGKKDRQPSSEEGPFSHHHHNHHHGEHRTSSNLTNPNSPQDQVSPQPHLDSPIAGQPVDVTI